MKNYERFSASGINALPRFGVQGDGLSILAGVRLMSPTAALYVHIPFCNTLCHFCMLRRGSIATAQVPDAFIHSLTREIGQVADLARDSAIDAVYFGGGTPSLLAPQQFLKIMECLGQHFSLASEVEITVEGEAKSLASPHLLEAFKTVGVSRVSYGVQTFDEALRHLLGRTDTLEQIFHVRRLLDDFGFLDVNVDLLYALPGTDRSFVLKELAQLNDLASTSIDCHPLKYSSCARGMTRRLVELGLSVPSSSVRIGMFECIRDTLQARGYHEQFADQYSRVHIDVPSRYMRHLYGLDGGEYIGVGPGARSHYGDVGTQNINSVDDYMEACEGDGRPLAKAVHAPLSDNYITCFPKRNDILSEVTLEKSVSAAFFHGRIKEFLELGYLQAVADGFCLTEVGLPWYQNLQEAFLSPRQLARHNETANLRESKLKAFGHHFDSLCFSEMVPTP